MNVKRYLGCFYILACLVVLFNVMPQRESLAETVEEPADYRLKNYDAPVPETLNGAKVINALSLRDMRDSADPIVIDVYPAPRKPKKMREGALWRPPPHKIIPGAYWLPFVGMGRLCPALEKHFATQLHALSRGDTQRTLVFYCRMNCWLSWNASKRAISLGYQDVYWFRDGMDDWLWEELPTEKGTPIPWPDCVK